MFWDSLTTGDRDALSKAGSRRTFPAGAHLFLYGDEPTHAMVILSGLVKLTRTSIEGKEILIELRGRGSVVGELGVIDDHPRSAAVVVVEPVEALVVPAKAFRELLLERGSIAYALLDIVTDKLRQATDRRLEAGVGDTQARLCVRLVELARSASPGPDGVIELEMPLTQQELADWIGVSRDAVVLALRRIRDLGWIETGRRAIRILDLAALEKGSVA